MADPSITYVQNRAPQLLAAMVAAAAVTMPRQEGALRGSLEEMMKGEDKDSFTLQTEAMHAAAGVVTGAGNLEDTVYTCAKQVAQ